MRVAILTDNDFGKVNGVTTTLKAVLSHAPLDVRPHVYTFADEAAHRPGYTALRAWGVPIPFYRDMRMYLPQLARLRERLSADGACAIHLTTPGPAGLAARRLASELELPLVGSYHTELGDYAARLSGSARLGRLMQDYLRWIYGACERVLVPSAATARRLVSDGWRAEQLAVWSPGVDSDLFHPGRRSAALRSAWRVSDRRPAILYAGRISKEKGLSLLPQIAALLDEYCMPHRFVVCGEGPMDTGLRRGLRDAVFTGVVDHAAMGEIMASADIFLFPSDTDTAGNVVLEAQACGLPVLVSTQGGPRENMLDGQTGFVCEAGSERAYCHRAADLLVNAGRRHSLSLAARKYALTRRWAAAMAPLFASYRTALRAAAARPTPIPVHEHTAHT